MRCGVMIGAVVLALVTPTIAFAEKTRANLGALTCTLVKPAQDAAQKMICGFKPSSSGAEEKYSGSIQESGKDLPAGKVVLIWAVLGPPDSKIARGFLSQPYVKANAGAGPAPMLVGEKDPNIVLQFETNDGASTYDSITRLELELTGTAA
jgi:hypothetical protein